jgi:hypothetical protein
MHPIFIKEEEKRIMIPSFMIHVSCEFSSKMPRFKNSSIFDYRTQKNQKDQKDGNLDGIFILYFFFESTGTVSIQFKLPQKIDT